MKAGNPVKCMAQKMICCRLNEQEEEAQKKDDIIMINEGRAQRKKQFSFFAISPVSSSQGKERGQDGVAARRDALSCVCLTLSLAHCHPKNASRSAHHVRLRSSAPRCSTLHTAVSVSSTVRARDSQKKERRKKERAREAKPSQGSRREEDKLLAPCALQRRPTPRINDP